MPNGVYNSYIHVTLGNLVLNSTEDHIMSLQHKRIASDLSSTVILTLYDATAFAIEAEILSGIYKFTYSYGYVTGNNSKTFTALITHVGVEMNSQGMTLTIEGAPDGSDQTLSPGRTAYDNLTIDEIVAEIALAQGWEMRVNVPTMPIEVAESSLGGASQLKTYYQDGIGVEAFIRTKLIPDAISAEGNLGDYEFYLETTAEGKFAYFFPKGYNSDQVTISYDYVIGADNERILSFNPDYEKLLVALVGGGGVDAEMLNATSNEQISYGIKKTREQADEPSVAAYLAGSAYSTTELKALSLNAWSKLSNTVYQATMEIMGEVNLAPMQYIDINVLTPYNTQHHTSGVYYINSIEDMIQEGTFTSTLNLTKTESSDFLSQVVVSVRPEYTSRTSTLGFTGVTSFTNPSTVNPYYQDRSLSTGVSGTEINKILESYLGIPYVHANYSRSGMDCCGLIYLAFKENGWGTRLGEVYMDQLSQEIYMQSEPTLFQRVSEAELISGDIIMMNASGHIGFSVGNGKMIHAPMPGDVVKIEPVWKYNAGYRYLGFTPEQVEPVVPKLSRLEDWWTVKYATGQYAWSAQTQFTPTGIVIHSTAWPGMDAEGIWHHFNDPNRNAAIHGVLDTDVFIEMLPFNLRGGHAGGTANDRFLGFELCEPPGVTYNASVSVITSYNPPPDFFPTIKERAIVLCTHICKEYGINPLQKNLAGGIISHYEAYALGGGSNHADIRHWWELQEGYTMDNFRSDVFRRLTGGG